MWCGGQGVVEGEKGDFVVYVEVDLYFVGVGVFEDVCGGFLYDVGQDDFDGVWDVFVVGVVLFVDGVISGFEFFLCFVDCCGEVVGLDCGLWFVVGEFDYEVEVGYGFVGCDLDGFL